MICPFCNTEIDGVNHNNRGLKCPACWYPLSPLVVELTPTQAELEPGTGWLDAEIVPDAVYNRLIKVYTNPGELWEASDEDLLAVRGIGKATLAKLRAAYGGDPV